MKSRENAPLLAPLALALFVACTAPTPAQNLDPAALLKPATDSWPQYHGDYSGRRHSPLNQITPQNVASLALAWAFQTHQIAQIKSSPLQVDGVLYFTVPDNIWAVDARSGHMIWHYHYTSQRRAITSASAASPCTRDWLYFTTPDCHLVSLNAKDGTVRWDQELCRRQPGLLGHHGAAGRPRPRHRRRLRRLRQPRGLSPLLRSGDRQAVQWQWDATPPLGTPNSTTGGMTWMTGTYDPALNLRLLGHRQSHPGAERQNPPRRQPLHLQHRRPQPRHRQAGLGASRPRRTTRMTGTRSRPRSWSTPTSTASHARCCMQASRNGYFFVLDRTNGKSLLTAPFGPVNWSLGVDKQGAAHSQPGQGAGAGRTPDRPR